MFEILKASARRIAASYLRAAVALLTATQITNWQDLRGLSGVAQSALIATIPAGLRALEAIAAGLDGGQD